MGGVESLTEGSWPFDQTNHSNGSTPMGSLDIMSFYKKEPTPPTPTEPDYLCFTANKAGATLRMAGMYTENYTGYDFALEYSTDGETWQDWNFTKGVAEGGTVPCVSDTLAFAAIGDKVYFRGNNINGSCIIDVEAGFVYCLWFCGAENSLTADNEFAVSGDLQTIVKDDGTDKEHGCFYHLFTNEMDESILITSAPDLTATSLVPSKYGVLFFGQSLLTLPAMMPSFIFGDLPESIDEIGCFSNMYGETSLTTPNIFANMKLPDNYDDSDVIKLLENIFMMYSNTPFNITNDNETLVCMPLLQKSLEFDGGTFYTFHLANYMDNINGFTIAGIIYNSNTGSGSIEFTSQNAYFGGHSSDSGDYLIWMQNNDPVEFSLTAYPPVDYQLSKWQSSPDKETWTDIQDAISATLTLTLTQAGDYHYKAIFEQTNQ